MIEYVHGNLFDSKMEMLVNAVNCVGVMGKGIALEFRNQYPDMYADYVRRCQDKEIKIGTLTLFKERDKTIINFPTKNDWREPSEVGHIYGGLLALRKLLDVEQYGIAIPALGCGNGGLSWNVVHPLFTQILGDVQTPIEIYLPQH